MAKWTDIGHPMGWLVYNHDAVGLAPRWVSKRKTHSVSYVQPQSTRTCVIKKLDKPGPPRSLYALGGFVNRWFGYFDPAKNWNDETQTFNYIAWCVFWSVPVVELTRKLLDRTISVEEENQLRAYLDKIPAHPPIATGHRQSVDSE